MVVVQCQRAVPPFNFTPLLSRPEGPSSGYEHLTVIIIIIIRGSKSVKVQRPPRKKEKIDQKRPPQEELTVMKDLVRMLRIRIQMMVTSTTKMTGSS